MLFQALVKALSPAEYEIPAWMGLILDRAIYKAAGHKYIRRVPTGKPGRYRYYYTVAGGHGIGHESEFEVGAAFRMKHDGKDGHFHIVGKTEDGKLKIKHDESGHETEIEAGALRGMLHAEHAEAINAHKARLRSDLAQASKTGSAKQRERLKAEAAKYGVHEGSSFEDRKKALIDRVANLQARSKKLPYERDHWIAPRDIDRLREEGDSDYLKMQEQWADDAEQRISTAEAHFAERMKREKVAVPQAPKHYGIVEKDGVSKSAVEHYNNTIKALNDYGNALDDRKDGEDLGRLRAKVEQSIRDHSALENRLQHHNRKGHRDRTESLKARLESLDNHAKMIKDARFSETEHDAAAFGAWAKTHRHDLEAAVAGATSGGVDQSAPNSALSLPHHVGMYIGNVPVEAGVRALLKDGKAIANPTARRVIHTLGGQELPLSDDTADLPHEAVKKITNPYERDRELEARAQVAKNLGVDISRVQPGGLAKDTTKEALTTGIEALRDRAASGDRAAEQEIRRRDRVARLMGHGSIHDMTAGGKRDPVWSKDSITGTNGTRWTRKTSSEGDAWHEIKNGVADPSGASRTALEQKHGRSAFTSGPGLSAEDHFSQAAHDTLKTFDKSAKLWRAFHGEAPIQTPAGDLPLEHIAAAAAEHDAEKNYKGRRKNNPLLLHEKMTDEQLAHVVKSGKDTRGVHQAEIDARQLAASPPTVEATDRVVGKHKVDRVGTHYIAKFGTGSQTSWGVWDHKGEPVRGVSFATKGAAAHAAADLSSGTSAETARKRFDLDTYERAAQLGSQRTSAHDAIAALKELHRQAPSMVLGPSEAQPKVLDVKQTRARMKDFVSTDESRPQIVGYFHHNGMATATDGHRMAMIPSANEGHTSGAIHRATDTRGLERQKAEMVEKMTAEGKDQAVIDAHLKAADEIGAAGARIDAAFPDYTQVIPRQTQQVDHLNAQHVQKVLALMQKPGVASDRTRGITIHRKGGEVLAVAHHPDSNARGVTVKLGHTSHPDGQIGISAEYLHDAVRGQRSGNFAMHWNSHESLVPIQVKRPDGEHHVIMPMRM